MGSVKILVICKEEEGIERANNREAAITSHSQRAKNRLRRTLS